jgi:hypothetical protein
MLLLTARGGHELKKLLVIVLLVLLMASVVITAGCGGSDNGEAEKDETLVTAPQGEDADRGEEVADYSPAGTYESDEGKFIRLNADGTFETDDWEEMTEGTYSFYGDQEGYWVDLTFEGGTLVVLSVIISMDEVAAVVDDFTLVQYTKK